MTRSERISDLLAITSRLISCMEREIALLRSLRTEEVKLLQLDKAAMADAYEAHLRALREPEGEEVEIPLELRAELVNATERFQAVLAENERALRAVREVNDRVLKAIVAAVEEKRGKPSAYAAKVPALARRAAAPAVSVTLNAQF